MKITQLQVRIYLNAPPYGWFNIFELDDELVGAWHNFVFQYICKMRNILPKTNEKNLNQTQIQLENNDDKTERAVDQYLQSLSKPELIQLLRIYASKTFWNELKNQHSDEDKAMSQFKKVEKMIHKIFLDDELLNDTLAFEYEIEKVFSQLIGLEKILPEKCGKLIFNFFESVNKAQYEGMLYDDFHDCSFASPEVLDHFIESYSLNLDFDKKCQFLNKLDQVLERQSYFNFFHLESLSNRILTKDELTMLKVSR